MRLGILVEPETAEALRVLADRLGLPQNRVIDLAIARLSKEATC